jgi:AcrR family transcriptional regulator
VTEQSVPVAPNSRDKILDVAEALFARSGFSGIGMREVAREVGLGKSSLFHHFPSKQALYFLVLERVLGRIAERILPLFVASTTPTQRLDALSDALVDALAEHPTSARLLLRTLFEVNPFMGSDAPPEAEAGDAMLMALIETFQNLIREGIECGEFRDVSPAHATQTIVGSAVFHFASGEFGESILGGSLFSADAVARRRDEQRAFFHNALVRDAGPGRVR